MPGEVQKSCDSELSTSYSVLLSVRQGTRQDAGTDRSLVTGTGGRALARLSPHAPIACSRSLHADTATSARNLKQYLVDTLQDYTQLHEILTICSQESPSVGRGGMPGSPSPDSRCPAAVLPVQQKLSRLQARPKLSTYPTTASDSRSKYNIISKVRWDSV